MTPQVEPTHKLEVSDISWTPAIHLTHTCSRQYLQCSQSFTDNASAGALSFAASARATPQLNRRQKVQQLSLSWRTCQVQSHARQEHLVKSKRAPTTNSDSTQRHPQPGIDGCNPPGPGGPGGKPDAQLPFQAPVHADGKDDVERHSDAKQDHPACSR